MKKVTEYKWHKTYTNAQLANEIKREKFWKERGQMDSHILSSAKNELALRKKAGKYRGNAHKSKQSGYYFRVKPLFKLPKGW